MIQHCYIVLYDQCQPARDYDRLYQALKSFPNWGKLTESAWAVVSESEAPQIRDYLKQFIDSGDRLIVIQSGRSGAWTKVLANDEWVKTNLVK